MPPPMIVQQPMMVQQQMLSEQQVSPRKIQASQTQVHQASNQTITADSEKVIKSFNLILL